MKNIFKCLTAFLICGLMVFSGVTAFADILPTDEVEPPFSATATPTPTTKPTVEPTPTATPTPTPSVSPTPTADPSNEPTIQPEATQEPLPMPVVTSTPTPTATPLPTTAPVKNNNTDVLYIIIISLLVIVCFVLLYLIIILIIKKYRKQVFVADEFENTESDEDFEFEELDEFKTDIASKISFYETQTENEIPTKKETPKKEFDTQELLDEFLKK